MKLLIDREWCLRAAEREEGEVGAGFELTDAEQLRPYITPPPKTWRLWSWFTRLAGRRR